MFWLKKIIFKFMELGLGLRTCFSLETKDPIFLNFRLTDEEAERVRRDLPPGFTLRAVRFVESDETPSYWISYNLYELKYPRKEMSHIKKGRCEINTFVEDATGRPGILVFSGSPYVSREPRLHVWGVICDLAERMVTFIYGCGGLIPLTYRLAPDRLIVNFAEGGNVFRLEQPLERADAEARLSTDYWRFNDISFFNGGKTYDVVNVGNSFFAARFESADPARAANFEFRSPYLKNRRPDAIYFHRGEIAYTVTSLNLAGAHA